MSVLGRGVVVVTLLMVLASLAFGAVQVAPSGTPRRVEERGGLGLDKSGGCSDSTIMNLSPQLWLAARKITSLTDGDAVTTWADASGNANDATQATAANKPTYRTNVVNGRPVVRFDGVNDAIKTGNITLGPFTVFTVFQMTTGTDGYVYAFGVSTDASFHGVWSSTGDTTQVKGGGLTSGKNHAANWAEDGAWKIVVVQYDGTHASHAMWINGAAVALTNSTGTGNAVYATVAQPVSLLGDGAGANVRAGDQAEFLAYNSALAAADRQRVERCLSRLYRIALAAVNEPPAWYAAVRGARTLVSGLARAGVVLSTQIGGG